MRTILFDAGGTLVFPDWALISATLARFGVRVDPAALAAAEPRARFRTDQPDFILRSTDDGRWSLFFGEILREWTRPNGLRIQKVRVPLGVVGPCGTVGCAQGIPLGALLTGLMFLGIKRRRRTWRRIARRG